MVLVALSIFYLCLKTESLLSFASCSLVCQSEFENVMVFSGAPHPSEIVVEVYIRVFFQPQPTL